MIPWASHSRGPSVQRVALIGSLESPSRSPWGGSSLARLAGGHHTRRQRTCICHARLWRAAGGREARVRRLIGATSHIHTQRTCARPTDWLRRRQAPGPNGKLVSRPRKRRIKPRRPSSLSKRPRQRPARHPGSFALSGHFWGRTSGPHHRAGTYARHAQANKQQEEAADVHILAKIRKVSTTARCVKAGQVEPTKLGIPSAAHRGTLLLPESNDGKHTGRWFD
ncbi:hypothetical protein GGR56DRAFT_403995 [Xylariaceae sp. FL0804]|nr:hypothetical protein GGR56DRAFT_403995 [Xylariaceae sp. FL0804]